VPWVYDVRIPGISSTEQAAIVKMLNDRGIAARHAFKPMSSQPEFVGQRKEFGSQHHADAAAREVIYFPLVGVEKADVAACFEVCRLVTGVPAPAAVTS
jgi:dTDP-4-amino-4,6-dideoxygalactose transaminase